MRMLSAAMTVITVGCVLPCCRSRGSSDADAKSELVAQYVGMDVFVRRNGAWQQVATASTAVQ